MFGTYYAVRNPYLWYNETGTRAHSITVTELVSAIIVAEKLTILQTSLAPLLNKGL